MEFDFFLRNTSKIEKIKVNSTDAHLDFTPKGRGFFSEEYKTESTRKAAVMAIISPIEGEAHITLIIRSKYDGAHSGQVAFAGGKWESNDSTLLETAFREVEEEIGVPKKKLVFCRTLTSVYIPVSDFRVYPYLAYAEKELEYLPQLSEVDKVITIPLSALFSSKAKKNVAIDIGNTTLTKVPAFVYKNYTIWGATSMILNELKLIIVKSMC